MQELFRHEALPYAGAARFAPFCAGAVRDGVESDERVIVLAASDRLDGVAERLGPDADEVTFVATDEHGRNPTRIATLLHTFETAGHGQRSLGVVDMSSTGRSRHAAGELLFSDAVLNLPALRSWPMSVVCLFDSEQLDEPGMHGVRRCHAVVRGQDTNVDYDPEYGLEMYGADLDPVPPSAARHKVARGGLGGMRDFVRSHAARYDIAPDRVTMKGTDTLTTPFDRSTGASRSTTVMGSAVRAAAEDLRTQLLEAAAEALSTDARNVVLRDGHAAAGESRLSYGSVVSRYFGMPGGELVDQ